MNTQLKTEKSIEIIASPSAVWDVLTNPEKIKIYLYGTETITDWKVGSSIVFQGNYERHTYQDKGNVLELDKNKILRYNYWSSMSGLEDKIENYFIVTYTIESIEENKVRLTWHQAGFSSEERKKHTEQGLVSLLEQIKKIAES